MSVLSDIWDLKFYLLAGAIGAIYLYVKLVIFKYFDRRGIPYERPTFPFGNVSGVFRGKMSIGEACAELYKKHRQSPYFGMFISINPALVINDPEIIRHVLTKDFSHFHDRGIYVDEKVDPLSGHLFSLPGEKWKNLRTKLTPTFTSGKIKQMFPIVNQCGVELGDCVEKVLKIDETVEIKDIVARYTTDVISNVAFGLETNSLKEPNNEFRRCGQLVFASRPLMAMLSFFMPSLLRILKLPHTDTRVTNFFTKVFSDTVNYRKQNNIKRHDMLNMLMQLMDKGYVETDDANEIPKGKAVNDSKKLEMTEATAQAFVFFIAGFETSSSTVTYCIFEMACHPEIQEKVYIDIDQALKKHGGLTYDSLAEMEYLSQAVDETLRLYPTLPILNRECTREYDVPGTNLHISKGDAIVIPVSGIHKDPNIYPDPEKFDPERFSKENKGKIHSHAYLPFGEGPRICIGKRFGLIQAKVALVSLLSRFRFSTNSKTEIPVKHSPGTIVMCPDHGVNLRVEMR
ncbi:probable cytochrome P450 6a14 [Cephus cinctus]|uniref:Probable cytochrome P450 6a14 n=1 Tax=Cephus cinctus TaxID=211228 RepID=A0AAJ7VX45_CEPCN|nr:probable cytochrome P450 6a14 [Cephus cinctus]